MKPKKEITENDIDEPIVDPFGSKLRLTLPARLLPRRPQNGDGGESVSYKKRKRSVRLHEPSTKAMDAVKPQTEKPLKMDELPLVLKKNTQFSKKLRLNYSKVKEIRSKKLSDRHREPELFLSIL